MSTLYKTIVFDKHFLNVILSYNYYYGHFYKYERRKREHNESYLMNDSSIGLEGFAKQNGYAIIIVCK